MRKSNLAQNWRNSSAKNISHKTRRSRLAYAKKNDLKFHNYGTVIFLLLLCIPIAFIGYKSKLVEKADAQMTVYAQAYQEEASKSAQLQQENDALKNQLSFSAKIVTPAVQRDISRFYIKKYFGSLAPTAEKIFTCESNLNPLAWNTHNKDGSEDRGVAQINSIHAFQFEKVTGTSWPWGAHDTESNIKFAKWLYDHSGWSAWTCYGILKIK